MFLKNEKEEERFQLANSCLEVCVRRERILNSLRKDKTRSGNKIINIHSNNLRLKT